jgi:hypothetical protein
MKAQIASYERLYVIVLYCLSYNKIIVLWDLITYVCLYICLCVCMYLYDGFVRCYHMKLSRVAGDSHEHMQASGCSFQE